jgi:hypothetical protein
LEGLGDSNVTLGESADFRGISTVLLGGGNATVDGSDYSTRQLNYDLRNIDLINSLDSLTGGTLPADTLNGTRFIVNSDAQLENSILVGNALGVSYTASGATLLSGVDTLQYTGINGIASTNTVNDSVNFSGFNPAQLRNIDVLQLAASTLSSNGTVVGNVVNIDANFGSTKLSTIIGDNSGDVFVQTAAMTTNNFGGGVLLGSSIYGGTGGDKFSLNSGSYLTSDLETLNGGTSTGINNLFFTQSNVTLNDVNLSNVKNMQGLAFDTVNSGTNKITLDKYATLSGLASISAGNGNVGGNGDTITQTQNFGNSLSLIGGAGNDVFQLNSTSLLGAGSTGNDNYIYGGAGYDTLMFFSTVSGGKSYSSNVNLTDAMFANFKAIEVLTLAGGNSSLGSSSITLGLNASLSGIRDVFGSYQQATFYPDGGATLATSLGSTFTQTTANNVAMRIKGNVGNDLFNVGDATLLAADTIAGGGTLGGYDTLAVTSGVDVLSDALFKNISSLQAVALSDAARTSSIVMDSLANATGIRLLYSSGAGIAATLGSGFTNAASVIGGNSNESVVISTLSQWGGNTYSLGGGIDTLSVLNSGGTAGTLLGDTIFSKMSGVEVLSLAGNQSISLTLSSNAYNSGISSVYGTNANDKFYQDTILGPNATILESQINYFGDDGNDSFILADRNMLIGDTINGAGGADSLTINTASTLFTGSDFANIQGIEALILSGNSLTGSSSINLNSYMVNTGLSSLFGGATASTLTQSAEFTNGLSLAGGAGADLFIINNPYYLTSGQDSIFGGGGNDSLQLAAAAVLADITFANLKQIGTLSLNGASSVTLDANANAAGITLVAGGASSGSFTQSSGDTLATTFAGGKSADLFTINSPLLGSLSSNVSIAGGSGTDTLSITTSSSSLSLVDTSFAARLTSVEVLKLSNTVNTVSLGSAATLAGISYVIGGTNDDSLNASGSYYGTSSGSSNKNYAVITALNSNNIAGNTSSDKLQLSQTDYDFNLYSLGNFANGGTQTTRHFGVYSNGRFVADVTTNFDVTTDTAGTNAFFNPNNNHTTYV